MNLICPRCHAKLVIDDSRVPPNGAWAKCPKCQERFFTKARPVLIDQTPATATKEAPALPGKRSQASQELLDRLQKKKTADEVFSDDTILITVFPEAVVNYQIYILFMILIGVGVIVVLIMGFQAAGVKGRAVAKPQPSRVIPEYGHQGLKFDLISLRSAFHSHRNSGRTVTYQSPESRFFKYALARLAPDLCQEIVSVRTWTDRPYHQFKAQAICLEAGWSPPVLEVVWERGQAIITFPDQADQMELVVDLAKKSTSESPVLLRPIPREPGIRLDLL